MTTPSDGARRSRRGYRYQDIHSMDRYLDLLDGHWDTITVEGDEDVTCEGSQSVLCRQHEQVKTIEQPSQMWSVAKVCAPEDGEPSRSILGRLFSGKVLEDRVTFRLVLNEEINDTLRVLQVKSSERDSDELATTIQAIEAKLRGIVLSDDRSVAWCVERLTVEIRSRTADELEAIVCRRLSVTIERECGERLLGDEVDNVFALLMDRIGRDSHSRTVIAVSAEEMRSRLLKAVKDIVTPVLTASTSDSSRLRSKLEPVGFDQETIDKCVAMHLGHRDALRRADPSRRSAIAKMVDEVFSACTQVRARQRLQQSINPGAVYVETMNSVQTLYSGGRYSEEGFDLADLLRAVHDITSRCQHRYSS